MSDLEAMLRNLSPEQQELVRRKKEELQRQFEEFSMKQTQNKIDDICNQTKVSAEEAGCALNLCENDEMEAINRLTCESSFKLKVKEMASGTSEYIEGQGDIGRQENMNQDMDEQDDVVSSADDNHDDDDDDHDEADYGRRSHKKKCRRSSRRSRGVVETGLNADGTPRAPTIRLGDALARLEESMSGKRRKQNATEHVVAEDETVTELTESQSDSVAGTRASPSKKKKKGDDDYTYKDLKKLDWSEARIKAFLGRKSNPNAYYYRFNDLGEEQATGGWTKTEHNLFMELIKDGVDYRWGILSKQVPGRVGYQCSNCTTLYLMHLVAH